MAQLWATRPRSRHGDTRLDRLSVQVNDDRRVVARHLALARLAVDPGVLYQAGEGTVGGAPARRGDTSDLRRLLRRCRAESGDLRTVGPSQGAAASDTRRRLRPPSPAGPTGRRRLESAPLVRALVDKTAGRVCDNLWQKRVAYVSSGQREGLADERTDLERAATRREGGDH